MSSVLNTSAGTQLNRYLDNMLRGAKVTQQALPNVPDISLFLIDPTPLQRRFTAEEIEQIEKFPAYWCFCWASGQALAESIIRQPSLVKDKTVLDFGAGSGVVGVAAKKAGACSVIVCDNDSAALDACRANAELNQVEFEYCSDLSDFKDSVDLLIAADVLYDRENLSYLDMFLKKSANVLIADSRMKDFQHPTFEKIAECQSATLPDLENITEFRHVNIYQSR